jgi:hypothetical protein
MSASIKECMRRAPMIKFGPIERFALSHVYGRYSHILPVC